MENPYKKLREDFEFTEHGYRMTADKLADIFKSKGYSSLTGNAIRKIETDKRYVSETELKAYREVFNTTSDFLLRFTEDPTRQENRVSASNLTGLNGKSIDGLNLIKQRAPEDIEILNYIMSDTGKFWSFLDCIKDFIEPGFITPLHPVKEDKTGNVRFDENTDIESDSIMKNKERCVYIGKESNLTFNGQKLFDHKAIPISNLSTLNLLQIQEILQSWKESYRKKLQEERKNKKEGD